MRASRWRPSVSLKTWIVLVALACGYLACWGPTQRHGPIDSWTHPAGPSIEDSTVWAVIPLLLGWHDFEPSTGVTYQRYSFWFFGDVARMPYNKALTPEYLEEFWHEYKDVTHRTATFGTDNDFAESSDDLH